MEYIESASCAANLVDLADKLHRFVCFELCATFGADWERHIDDTAMTGWSDRAKQVMGRYKEIAPLASSAVEKFISLTRN